MKEGARVFGDGDITVVLNAKSSDTRVYIGAKEVSFLSGVKLSTDGSQATSIELVFKLPSSPLEVLKIEEQTRAVKQFPWVKVARGR